MENRHGEPGAGERAGVGRNQNVLHEVAHDAAAVSEFIGPALARVERDVPGIQLLVLTPDAEVAIAVAAVASRASEDERVPVLPVTTARRAARLLSSGTPGAIAGAPDQILDLIQSSRIKLDTVTTLVVAWADAIVEAGFTEALEAIVSEIPREASRTIVTSHTTPEVEALVERYARRPRRSGANELDWLENAPIDARYMIVAPQTRPAALRRLLDDVDPPRAAVYVNTDETAQKAESLIRSLGYAGADSPLVLTRGDAVPGASLVVLFELPPNPGVLRDLAEGEPMIVALITPRQQATLRALCGTGQLTPYTLTGAAAGARSREEKLRDELRRTLEGGVPTRELLAIEPLLVEYDGAEVAGAALWLLERERARERAAAAAVAAETPRNTRLFVNAGERDGISARDLVGAIANEAGIPGGRIGKVELRENHSLVEVPLDRAQQIATRLTGVTLRGRRIVARVDQGAPAERGERGERAERRPPSRERMERGERGERSDRGERRERPERGERGGRFERGGRGERGERGERFPRGERSDRAGRFDRADRGERGPRSERGPRGGRPGRPRE
ncbi:MAG TPA: DEAD/DEAH box helicase [Gemmatimonadaceae bacterium]|nr:DEAD/DEAH box helicase [Gemmatimonadaceae bacterium]